MPVSGISSQPAENELQEEATEWCIQDISNHVLTGCARRLLMLQDA